MRYEFNKTKIRKSLNFYCDKEHLEKVIALAEKENRSVSNTLFHIIKKYFEGLEDESKLQKKD